MKMFRMTCRPRCATMETMDHELRDWLRGLSTPVAAHGTHAHSTLSEGAADYLAQIVADGTLKAAFAELAAGEPELAG